MIRLPCEWPRRTTGAPSGASLRRGGEHRGQIVEVGVEPIDVAALAGGLAVAADVVGERRPARLDDHVRDLAIAPAVLRVAVRDHDDALRGAAREERLGVEPADRLGLGRA